MRKRVVLSIFFVSYVPSFSNRAAYLVVLKICKLLLTTVGKCIVQVETDSVHCHGSPDSLSPSSPNTVMLTGRVSVLQQALTHIPNPNSEFMLRNVSSRLAQLLHDQVCIMLVNNCLNIIHNLINIQLILLKFLFVIECHFFYLTLFSFLFLNSMFILILFSVVHEWAKNFLKISINF